jgi:hypothetical protein
MSAPPNVPPPPPGATSVVYYVYTVRETDAPSDACIVIYASQKI